MKKLTLFALSLMLFSNAKLLAQTDWHLGGNNLSSSQSIGSNTNFSVIFKTNNTERGRITNGGNWGIGTTSPGAKFHVNSAAGFNSIRAQVNGVTKFLAHSAGGVAIGANETPPTNGLYVAGDAGFGTTFPQAKIHINSAADQYPLRAQVNGLTALLAHNNGGVSVGSAAIPPANGLSVNIGNAGFGTATPGDYRVKIVHGIYGLNLEQSSTGNDWELLTSSTNALFLYYNRVIKGIFDETSGVYSSVSDEQLKTNIKAMPSVLSKIHQLKPATYQFKDASTTGESTPDIYGFLAQDVRQVFPHLVRHHVDKDRNLDTYTLDYSGFGVIAIKAIQEMQQTIEAQQKIIQQQQQQNNAFQERLAKVEAALASGKNSLPGSELLGISLEQNQPNPFNQSTTFRYTIPAKAQAQIFIYESTSGKLRKTLAAPAVGQVQIDTSDLKPGTYVYTLMVDGKLAASKQMVLLAP